METSDLRNAGLKVTLPRLKILELLEKSDRRHLSAEDIYRMLIELNEDVGLATVYRYLLNAAVGLAVFAAFALAVAAAVGRALNDQASDEARRVGLRHRHGGDEVEGAHRIEALHRRDARAREQR